MENNIHIGNLLKRYIKENNVSKAALSRALGIGSANLEVRLKHAWIRTDILLKISNLLEHNFFADIAALLPEKFLTNKTADSTKDKLIAELELEIKILKRERDVLSNLISSKIN
jgi:DNA-binding Xre family transcriptional regulator